MIERSYTEVHSKEWKKLHILKSTHELVFLREIIPWQLLIDLLSPFYSTTGKKGKSLRMVVGILLLQKLKQLSNREVIDEIQTNRYYQYFCNIPDEELFQFLHHSSLSIILKRLGVEGVGLIEYAIFDALFQIGFIRCDQALIDSTVQENNIVFPTDTHLVFKAFLKMESFAKTYQVAFWWEHDVVKKLWRTFNLDKAPNHWLYLFKFYHLFKVALIEFEKQINSLNLATKKHKKAKHLLALLELLFSQTQQKLAGEKQIKARIISLDEVDARPIKKGKRSTEFGSSIQMSFNRDGFMITNDICIGQANDKAAYLPILRIFVQRMRDYPDTAVTDKMYRTKKTSKTRRNRSKTFLWGAPMMSMKPFDKNATLPEPPPKASLPSPKISEGFENHCIVESTVTQCGQLSAKPPTTSKSVFNFGRKNELMNKLMIN
jgi:IS5 family transposase